MRNYNPFDSDWALFWVDFIFRHYDGVKLLICCSEGSAYENFEEDLIRAEAKANKEYADILCVSGKMSKEIPDIQWHILATAYLPSDDSLLQSRSGIKREETI